MAIELTDDDNNYSCWNCGEDVFYSKRHACPCDIEPVPTDEPSEPQEDDITTEDHERFYQNGKLVLERAGRLRGDELAEWYSWDVGTCHLLGKFGDDHIAALRAYMEHTQFWPAVWLISDHGNAHLMDLTEGKGK